MYYSNLQAPVTTFSFSRGREEGLIPYFSMKDTFVFLDDISGLLHTMGWVYDLKEWRLFLDNSKASLKCVLLHNGNKYASVRIVHSVHLKETCKNMKILITKIKYSVHNLLICGGLKVLCMLLGQ